MLINKLLKFVLSKYLLVGSRAARNFAGFFYAYIIYMAVLYPCAGVIMVPASPLVDLDNRKGSTATFFTLLLKNNFMSKKTSKFCKSEKKSTSLQRIGEPQSSDEILNEFATSGLELHRRNLTELIVSYLSKPECPNDELRESVSYTFERLLDMIYALQNIYPQTKNL